MAQQQYENLTEYIRLDESFTTVFREPAVIELVCRSIGQKIRKLQNYSKSQQSHQSDASHRNRAMWWAYATMTGPSAKDLHPPGNQSKMSINAHIAMTRWVIEMVRRKCDELKMYALEGYTVVNHYQTAWKKNRTQISIHPQNEITHRRVGNILLWAERKSWLEYITRLEATLSELIRLRDILSKGYCDGDRLEENPLTARGEE